MAQEQPKKEINVRGVGKVDVEKDKVPKLASHFESLTEKIDPEQPQQVEAVAVKIRGIQFEGGAKNQDQGNREAGRGNQQAPSLEELTRYRQQAQQSSVDVIRAAEDSSNRAKAAAERKAGQGREAAGGKVQSITQQARVGSAGQTRDAAGGKVQFSTHQAAEKARPAAETRTPAEKTGQTKDSVMQGAQTGTRIAAEKAGQTKESVMQGAQTGTRVAAEKTGQLKDSVVQGAQAGTRIAAEKVGKTKDYLVEGVQTGTRTAAEKAAQAKDAVRENVQTGAQIAAGKAAQAKDTLVQGAQVAGEKTGQATEIASEKAKTLKDYTVEKAVAAKDTTVDVGSKAASYLGETTAKVAAEAKDLATVAGWEAARFTAEKAAQATRVVADVAAVAKDKVAGAGQTVAGYTGEKLAAAKDAVVATEESAAEYAARKKVEAQRDREAKKQSSPTQTTQEGGFTRQEEAIGKEWETKPREKAKEFFQDAETGPDFQEQGETGSQPGVGVLHAIGETLVEIGQTTKDILVGHDLPGQRQSYPQEEPNEEEVKLHYRQGS